jgi:glutamate dehydrogenase/leucine dehydrogenase
MPAAKPDALESDHFETFRARLVLQRADIAAAQKAEQRLHDKGMVPASYFIINAGNVITAAMEHKNKSGKEAFEAVSARIRKNTNLILEKGYERESSGASAHAIAP